MYVKDGSSNQIPKFSTAGEDTEHDPTDQNAFPNEHLKPSTRALITLKKISEGTATIESNL